MGKIIIIFLVLFLVLTFSIIVINFEKTDEEEKVTGKITNAEENDKNVTDEENFVNTTSVAGGSRESDAVGLDLSKSPCGLNFERYGVCAGTCEIGECIRDERSCYCKEF